jgi:hypothetical protein
MNIIDLLASSLNQRGSEANLKAAFLCLETPALLSEITANLTNKNVKIAADCCEVMTEVARLEPELIQPYAHLLPAMFSHKNGRVQWESMHAFALTAHLIPDVITPLLPTLLTIIETSPGIIIRDYAIDALGGYARCNQQTAETVFPLLKRCFSWWEGRHAGHILTGLQYVLSNLPAANDEICQIAQYYSEHPSGAIKKTARSLLKACNCS